VLAMKASNGAEPIAVFGARVATTLGQGKTDNGRALRHKDDFAPPGRRVEEAVHGGPPIPPRRQTGVKSSHLPAVEVDDFAF
jgi:hypothetical protein